jgi:hypothetical protein
LGSFFPRPVWTACDGDGEEDAVAVDLSTTVIAMTATFIITAS